MSQGNVNNFYKGVFSKYEAARGSRFHVKMGLPSGLLSKYNRYMSDLVFLCENAELPGVSFSTIDRKTYGVMQKMPNQILYSDINLTFICTERGLWQKSLFDDWMEYINPRDSYNFKYKNTYTQNIEIIQYENRAKTNNENDPPIENYKVILEEAYPTSVNPIGLNWSDDSIIKLTVNFAYTRWRKVDKSVPPAILAPPPPTNVNEVQRDFGNIVVSDLNTGRIISDAPAARPGDIRLGTGVAAPR